MLNISTLLKKDEIVFGPFVGEMGWEIYKWSTFIKWFKKTYSDKKIIVSTRQSRKDLYYNSTDKLELFEIEGDYSDFIPKCYDCPKLPDPMYLTIIKVLKDKYPNALMVSPKEYKCDGQLFDSENMDFTFDVNPSNKNIIETILQNNKEKRIPIVIHSIDRKETNKKNWGCSRWKQLFDLIENSKKFFVFITGFPDSYYRSQKEKKYFYVLEDFANTELDTTNMGLMIEAIKSSKLTIASQTYSILLSNLLKTPTLYWGNNIRQYSISDNPLKTKSIGIEDYTFITSPSVVFRNLRNIEK